MWVLRVSKFCLVVHCSYKMSQSVRGVLLLYIGTDSPLFRKPVMWYISESFISIGSSNQIFPPWYWLIINLAASFFKPSNPIIWGIPGNFYLSFLQFFCISIGHTKSSIAIGHLLVPISKKNIWKVDSYSLSWTPIYPFGYCILVCCWEKEGNCCWSNLLLCSDGWKCRWIGIS